MITPERLKQLLERVHHAHHRKAEYRLGPFPCHQYLSLIENVLAHLDDEELVKFGKILITLHADYLIAQVNPETEFTHPFLQEAGALLAAVEENTAKTNA